VDAAAATIQIAPRPGRLLLLTFALSEAIECTLALQAQGVIKSRLADGLHYLAPFGPSWRPSSCALPRGLRGVAALLSVRPLGRPTGLLDRGRHARVRSLLVLVLATRLARGAWPNGIVRSPTIFPPGIIPLLLDRDLRRRSRGWLKRLCSAAPGRPDGLLRLDAAGRLLGRLASSSLVL
jgi:hypothetical protein